MSQSIEPIRDLSLNVLRRYLVTHGWNSLSFPERNLTLFTLPADDEDNIEIVLPTFSDYDKPVPSALLAVQTLAQINARSIEETIQDVRSIAFDVLRSRVPDEYVRLDSIELRLATEFIEGMREFLSSSASTELTKERYFGRTRKEAIEYAGSCRFGHTFRGSFGFLIESPVGLNDEPTMWGMSEIAPFSRLVIQRIARGLQAMQSAIKTESVNPILENYEVGLSANMCDDLVDLLERTKVSKLKMDIGLSPEWHSPPDLVNSNNYTMSVNHIDLLKDAAKRLRAQDVSKNVTVVGRIKRLDTEGNPADLLQDNSDREISINWDSDEFGQIRVRVYLEPGDYLAAVEAHKEGKYVSIQGVLERQGRIWILTRPKKLIVLPI